MHSFNRTLPTSYNENYYAQPYFLWKNCADDTTIQRIIDAGEALQISDARIGGGPGDSRLDEKTRISKLSWINYSEEHKDIYDFFIDRIDRLNYWHYGMILTGMDSIQYTRYPVGGHYKFHNDVIARKENSMRKLSIVLSLSSSSDYEGGELLLSPHGDNPSSIKLERGDFIAFPSYTPHKVTPVTSGHRITAVSWVLGPKFV